MTCAHGVNLQLKMMDWRDMSLSTYQYGLWICSLIRTGAASLSEISVV